MPPAEGLFRSPFKASLPFNPEPVREVVRGAVTVAATAVFFVVVWFYLHQAAAGSEASWSRITQAMQAVLPAVTSVLGTSLGFYFGSQKR